MCLESNSSQDIEYRRIDSWNVEMIADLYRAGGWWKEEWDPEGISALIKGSLVLPWLSTVKLPGLSAWEG